MSHPFQIATLTSGLLQPSIAIATHRVGELGILDFEYVHDPEAAVNAIQRLSEAVRGPFGIKIRGDAQELLASLAADLPNHLKTIIFTHIPHQKLREHVQLLQAHKVTLLLEATCLEEAQSAEAAGFDGLVAKGNEAGGRVADETAFILLQRFRAEVRLPVWAFGGIGLHTAAACAAAGAAGLILDAQLALTRESPLPAPIKARIASMDGSETICLGEQLGETYRIYFRPGSPVVKELQGIEARLANDDRPQQEILSDWRRAMAQKAGWQSEQNALMLGQDAAFAAPLAKRFRTVGGVLQAVREAIRTHSHAAEKLRPLAEGSTLARSHGTRYPILQGPMTRVSDVPEFAAQVAEGGALPFLALALMRGAEVRTLLAQPNADWGPFHGGSAFWGSFLRSFARSNLR